MEDPGLMAAKLRSPAKIGAGSTCGSVLSSITPDFRQIPANWRPEGRLCRQMAGQNSTRRQQLLRPNGGQMS